MAAEAVARPGRPLPAVDRAHPRPGRAAGRARPVSNNAQLVSLFERTPTSSSRAPARFSTDWFNLTAGKSGGPRCRRRGPGNPADAERFLCSIMDHRRAAAANGRRWRYASLDNLYPSQGPRRGYRLPQKARPGDRRHGEEPLGLSQAAQLPLPGSGAGISCFKRAYGGSTLHLAQARCFKAYIWSAVVATTLVLFARLRQSNSSAPSGSAVEPTCGADHIRLPTPTRRNDS